MSIQGKGDFRYEVVEGWAKLPHGMKLGYTHGIVADKEDNIYIFHTGTPNVIKFDLEGNYLSSWGDAYEGGAHGFYLHHGPDGDHFYITDTANQIVAKTTLDGQELLRIGTPDLPEVYDADRKFVPTDVAVSPNGDIYIADGYGQSYIHQYSAQGEYIRSWRGDETNPDGRLKCPHGISVNPRSAEPELYVADRGNHRIQVFTMDGQSKRMFGHDMLMPCSFYFLGEEMYFPDLHCRVSVFDQNDQLITHLGEDQEAKSREGWPNVPPSVLTPGVFSSPHGICVNSQGDVFVAEWIEYGRITKLARVK